MSIRVNGKRRRRRNDTDLAEVLGGVLLIIVLVGTVAAFGWVGGIVCTLAVSLLLAGLRALNERGIRPRTPTARELSAKLENIGAMTGGQFEVFVAELLRAQGHQATVLGGSGDQGVDIIAVIDNQRVAIQCKNYKKPVGNRPVQEVFAGARHHGCQQAWVVAPAGFTKGAVKLARSVGVRMFEASSIQAWIQQADKRASEQEQGGYSPNRLEEAFSEVRFCRGSFDPLRFSSPAEG